MIEGRAAHNSGAVAFRDRPARPRLRNEAVRRGIGAGVFAACLAAAAQVAAQQIPSPVLPGRIGPRFQEPTAPPVAPPVPELAPLAPQPAKPSTGISFTLKQVIIEGNTVYTPEQLRPAYAPFLGKTMTIEGLAQLEEAITRKYRSDGYILARALVPSGQEIDPAAGVVHVHVYEGYIDKVRLDPLEYEIGARGGLLRSILKKIAHACRPGDVPHGDQPCPLHRDTLERYLLLANDLPGVSVSAVIQPSSETTGAADLFVTITEKPYDASAKLDNRGSVFIGPLRFQQQGALNNVFGLYDRTEVHVVESIPFNELMLINGIEEIPLTSEGLRLSVDATHSRARPGDSLRPLALTTIGDEGGLTLSYPYLRTRSENLLLHARFEVRNAITTHPAALQTEFFDRTRVFSLGGTYDLADRWLGVNLVDFAWGQGLPILGATKEDSLYASHLGASPSFSKFTGEVSRLQQVFPEWNILGAATGQYSFSKLLASEQFGYGGEEYGRAYDPSEVLGDRGVAAKTELQYTPAWAPGLLGWEDGLRSLQFYAYYDIGRAWDLAPDPSSHLSGASAGGGIRFAITDYLSGYIEGGKPLTRAVQGLAAKGQDGKAPRFFFSIASKF